MKIGRAKEYISLNLASLLGYFCFAATYYFCAFFIPLTKQWEEQEIGMGHSAFLTGGSYLLAYYKWHLIIVSILALSAVIEYILKKRGKFSKIDTSKIPPALIRVHPYIFWLGIFFAFIPIHLLVLFFLIATFNAQIGWLYWWFKGLFGVYPPAH
jgi:hypothetical protein